jgi:ATP-binding cassette subfamily G (WHITE) protein 2 (PDR)
MICDLPYKIVNGICFSLIIYFMTNLKREPGAYFFFLLVSTLLTMIMSSLFRFIASASRSLTEALTPVAILILALVVYTGFALSRKLPVGPEARS